VIDQTGISLLIAGLLVFSANPVVALDLADFYRTTHVVHAGEPAHEYLGGGQVQWQMQRSQAGSMLCIPLADCGQDDAARAEYTIRTAPPFDKIAL